MPVAAPDTARTRVRLDLPMVPSLVLVLLVFVAAAPARAGECERREVGAVCELPRNAGELCPRFPVQSASVPAPSRPVARLGGQWYFGKDAERDVGFVRAGERSELSLTREGVRFTLRF